MSSPEGRLKVRGYKLCVVRSAFSYSSLLCATGPDSIKRVKDPLILLLLRAIENWNVLCQKLCALGIWIWHFIVHRSLFIVHFAVPVALAS